MYQFFVEPSAIHDKKVYIDGPDYNHIKNVLRMQPGEEVAVSNGTDGREYRCAIASYTDSVVELDLLFIKEADVELPARICLFQGLPKGDKLELIIQKSVELGVYEIIPVAMSRSIMKIDDKKADKKTARFNEIARAAAKQSKRAIVPKVHAPMSMKQAVAYAEKLDMLLVPYEMADDMQKTRELLEGIKPGQSLGFFIGPEGGIAPEELEALKGIGASPITLGRRILRTETAGLTFMSWLVYLLEGRND